MSVSKPDYLEEDSVFVQKVESDRNVCSSCYRKIREHSDPHPDLPDVVSGITEYNPDTETGYFDDFKFSGRPSVKHRYCVCGVVDWNDAKIRPLSLDEMMETAERVSERLAESGVEHDRDVFLSYVEDHAQLPEYQFREEKVFEEAVEVSLPEE